MSDIPKALGHLEDAEAAIMSWWQRIEDTEDEEIDVPFSSLLAAVLRSVSRAAGALDANSEVVS